MKTKTNTEHTPTPCKIMPVPKVSLDGIKGQNYYIEFQNGERVLCASRPLAEFIIRAVNSHEALLKAAKYSRNVLGDLLIYMQATNLFDMDKGTSDAIAVLDKAIAQAEGRS